MKRATLKLSKTDLANLEVAVRIRLESEEDHKSNAWFQRARKWRRMLGIVQAGQRQFTAKKHARMRAAINRKYSGRGPKA